MDSFFKWLPNSRRSVIRIVTPLDQLMASDPARDNPQFELDKRVWRRYLVDWCHMSDTDFQAFLDHIGSTSAGVIFHEEAFYYIKDALTDQCGNPLPYPDESHDFFRRERFNYGCLHRAIYRDVQFDDTTDEDGAWEAARERAIAELAKHGFKLRDYSQPKTG